MKTIKQIYQIKASVEDVWKAFVDPKKIDEWGGGPAKMDEKVGTKFSLWDGDIHGTNLTVIKEKKLVQEWYSSDVEGKTLVTFILSEEKNGTKVELIQEDVPDEKEKDLSDGWKDYYMGPLKEFVES